MTDQGSPLARSQDPQSALALHAQIGDLNLQVHNLQLALQQQQATVAALQARIPNSAVVSPKFLNRAFAIWGHTLVAGLIIGFVFYCGVFILMMVFGGLGSLGNY